MIAPTYHQLLNQSAAEHHFLKTSLLKTRCLSGSPSCFLQPLLSSETLRYLNTPAAHKTPAVWFTCPCEGRGKSLLWKCPLWAKTPHEKRRSGWAALDICCAVLQHLDLAPVCKGNKDQCTQQSKSQPNYNHKICIANSNLSQSKTVLLR